MTVVINGTTGITTPKLDASDLELGSKNVVERGSNANGEYVRFADGTQICFIPVPTATYVVTTPTGTVYRTGVNTATLPVVFDVTKPSAVSVVCSAADGRVWGGVGSITGGTVVNWLAFAGLSIASVSEGFSITAIGRWF